MSALTPDPSPATAPFLVGTAGWLIPSAVAESFPASGTHLQRYAARMPAVEINSSFHRPHRRAVYDRWAASTPDDFRFSVKIPKDISHVRKLVDADWPLDTFLEQAGGLGTKLSIVLLQLPPSLAFEPGTAAAFLDTLRRRLRPGIEIACEPRHATWFVEEADACLAHHRVARVAADPVRAPGADRPGGWTGLRYRRLHGSPRVYYSSYGHERLAALADAMQLERDAPGRSWCMFDNTASGAAARDAVDLAALLQVAGEKEAVA